MSSDLDLEQQLLAYYVSLKTPIPEGGAEWNLSPEHHYLFGFSTRDFLYRNCELLPDMRVCNIGIGMGDWDDYLGYWLHKWGTLTSVDIDENLCGLFAYRQKREQHSNPSSVVAEDILHTSLPAASFDLVTIIGSTTHETGQPEAAMNISLKLAKSGGHVLYMGTTETAPESWFKDYLKHLTCRVTHHENFTYYSGPQGVPSHWWKMVAIPNFNYHSEVEGYAYLLEKP